MTRFLLKLDGKQPRTTHNYHGGPADHFICDSLQRETQNFALFMNAIAAPSKECYGIVSRVWYDDDNNNNTIHISEKIHSVKVPFQCYRFDAECDFSTSLYFLCVCYPN